MKNTGQQAINENILDSVTVGTKIYVLEKRADNLFLIRDGGKTLSMHTKEDEARYKLNFYKDPIVKGGDQMTNQQKFAEAGEKLHAEKAATEEQALAKKEEVKSELASLQENTTLAAMYNESAQVGAANLGGQSLPILRIHAAGKSTNNELVDGTEPTDGAFYYKPTKEDLGNTIDVHILTISHGFKTAPMEGSDKEYTFNQIVGGIIGNDKPFLMYFNGSKLQNLWNFAKEAAQYTRRKPVSFPMFSLSVRMSTKKGEKGKYAAPWIVAFEIVRNEDNTPKLILDEGEFAYIKDNVTLMEDTIEGLIAAKELKSAQPSVSGNPVAAPIEGEAVADGNPENVPWEI